MSGLPEHASAPVAAQQRRYVGERIELLHSIGEGGCASVWLGRHRDTGALVAVKLAHTSVDRVAMMERFQREAEVAARLSHRNIVRIHDSLLDHDGQPVLIMELLRGESLDQLLARKGRLSAQASAAVIVPLLRALEHAHERQVIHRDLKPGNLFLSVEPDGMVIPKLLDFGIAKPTETGAVTLTQRGEVLGTAPYMSPEQVRGETLTGRSDLFSVGTLLYELVTGVMPFAARSVQGAMIAVVDREVGPHPAIPPPLWPVIERALRKPEAERYPSAREMREALTAAVGHHGEETVDELRALEPISAPLQKLPPRQPSSASFDVRRPEHAAALRATAIAATPVAATAAPRSRPLFLWAAAAAGATVLLGGVWWGGARYGAAAAEPPMLEATLPSAPAPPSAALSPAPAASLASSAVRPLVAAPKSSAGASANTSKTRPPGGAPGF